MDMLLIGLVGGTGWASTVEYYRLINEKVNEKLGGVEFVRCVIYSLNYGDIHKLNNKGDNEGIYSLVLDAATKLKAASVNCLVLCANTLHQFAERLQNDLSLPVIHIAEATAKAIKANQFGKAALLGTRQTMEMDFYKNKLADYGIEIIVPDAETRKYIDHAIRSELVKGIFLKETADEFNRIIENLYKNGAECIILGCTEIPLLVGKKQGGPVLLDTLAIHAGAIAEYYLSRGNVSA